ncbi:hypothetical protein [Agathobaculum sp.]|nr:hypothetical protein [Agathobaculum sp.]MDY3619408.1 hypothetical protein [Agathobaculum sp.]
MMAKTLYERHPLIYGIGVLLLVPAAILCLVGLAVCTVTLPVCWLMGWL